MTIGRWQPTATLLNDGRVLVVGGFNGGALTSAELYDPADDLWTSTGSTQDPRYLHTATLLPNGRVLVAGGSFITPDSNALATSELYNPATGSWSSTANLAEARHSHSATLLPNGKVLVAGGVNTHEFASAELFDPATGTWSATGSVKVARQNHTATLLNSGQVLVAGGFSGGNVVVSTEVYRPRRH